ncbi:tetratricopeptide repeat protein [Vibrio hannami]|uniref:tetratricopeptide repeat protein n=1 Tax=Vibrio hannami TaxID=2717094 RepID=UPI00240F1F6C|nr:tetratricopeptide repeat protein [Vibrio hannami]MDG3084797.1 tetratricopeptide repeat protein [Vibrio hannami]
MSVINNALTNIAKKENGESSTLKRAEIPQQKRSGKLAWAIGGFTLSLALGGWAVSTQIEDSNSERVASAKTTVEVEPLPVPEVPLTEQNVVPEKTATSNKTVAPKKPVVTEKVEIESPTTKLAQNAAVPVYEVEKQTQKPAVKKAVVKKEERKPAPVSKKTAKSETAAKPKQPKKVVAAPEPASEVAKPKKVTQEEPFAVAQVASNPKTIVTEPGSLQVKQVELTPEQISQKAVERAKRALDSNDLETAIKEYEKALKYKPSDDNSRRKLAALYYGKQNVRKSVDVLRQGIRLDEDNQSLRIALSKILVREGQQEAALSPLIHLPESPTIDYLSLRAGLAQQAKINDIALETYQLLVNKEGDNGRWWLGLAIQQERALQYQEAIYSYTQAQTRVGVSNNTQAFIRDRLSLLNNLVGNKNAN